MNLLVKDNINIGGISNAKSFMATDSAESRKKPSLVINLNTSFGRELYGKAVSEANL